MPQLSQLPPLPQLLPLPQLPLLLPLLPSQLPHPPLMPQHPGAPPLLRPHLPAAPLAAAALAAGLSYATREVDVCELFRPPGRASRPERIVILLRGLPGSGKSRLARLIKQEEVAHGGSPPRVLCLDDYHQTEDEESGEMVCARDAQP